MRLSNRITGINAGASDGWDLYYRARGMKASGIPVTELTIGEHDFTTHPSIIDAMHHAAMDGYTGYAAVPGLDSLRQTIAQRLQTRTGIRTTAKNVLVTPGGQSALYAAHHAVLDEGDRALCIDPYYVTYPGTIRSLGANPVFVRTRAEDEFQPSRSALTETAPQCRSILINSPNNPTGVLYSRETLNTIAEICVGHGLWLVSDEVYDTMVWDGEHISPRTLPDMAERTLVIGSMSKSHAMTGWRCGWIVGPEKVIACLVNLATNTTYGVPGFVQKASVFALTQGSQLEAEVAAPFRRRRDLACQVIDSQNIVAMTPASGAMYVMLDIRATGMTGEGFANRLLDEHGIAVMPGESFGQAALGHIRVALTVPEDTLAEAMETLCFAAARMAP